MSVSESYEGRQIVGMDLHRVRRRWEHFSAHSDPELRPAELVISELSTPVREFR